MQARATTSSAILWRVQAHRLNGMMIGSGARGLTLAQALGPDCLWGSSHLDRDTLL